jgi:hypothetical protein
MSCGVSSSGGDDPSSEGGHGVSQDDLLMELAALVEEDDDGEGQQPTCLRWRGSHASEWGWMCRAHFTVGLCSSLPVCSHQDSHTGQSYS